MSTMIDLNDHLVLKVSCVLHFPIKFIGRNVWHPHFFDNKIPFCKCSTICFIPSGGSGYQGDEKEI